MPGKHFGNREEGVKMLQQAAKLARVVCLSNIQEMGLVLIYFYQNYSGWIL